MKSLGNLSSKDQIIVDTLLMRCQREWVSSRQLSSELKLPNTNYLIGYIKILRAEGYVFEHKTSKHTTWYRIKDFKEKRGVGVQK